jgi:hypothetical protein
LVGLYAKLVAEQWESPAVQQTCYPTVGLVLEGNMLRCVWWGGEGAGPGV